MKALYLANWIFYLYFLLYMTAFFQQLKKVTEQKMKVFHIKYVYYFIQTYNSLISSSGSADQIKTP